MSHRLAARVKLKDAHLITRFADICISPDGSGSGLGEQEIALVDLTPFGPLRLVEAPRTVLLTTSVEAPPKVRPTWMLVVAPGG